MRLLHLLTVAAALASVGGAPPVPPSRTPPPPSRSLFERPAPLPPRLWDQIQDPLDRSTGRIVDEPTYQLDRLERGRDADAARIAPQRESERLREEIERRMRLEQQAREQQQFNTEAERRAEMDRREYQLYLNGGPSALSLQVMSDQHALDAAKNERDQALLDAQAARAAALRDRPEDRGQIEQEYLEKAGAIRQEYEQRRGVILGMPPATAPASQPSE